MRRPWLRLLSGTLLLALAGCGSSQLVVHGMVTANGQNIEEGQIDFQPLDDRNPTFGTDIKNGKYTVKVNRGKYEVMVSGGGKAPVYPKSQEDLKTMSDKDLVVREQVPADAKGNRQQVEISGAQELNITLEYPIRKKP
jgi:hypothetical protein